MRTDPIRTGSGAIIATAPNDKKNARFFSLPPPSRPIFGFLCGFGTLYPLETGACECKVALPPGKPVLPFAHQGGRKDFAEILLGR